MSTKTQIEEGAKERGCCGGHASDAPAKSRSMQQDRDAKRNPAEKNPPSGATSSCCGGSNNSRSKAELERASGKPRST